MATPESRSVAEIVARLDERVTQAEKSLDDIQKQVDQSKTVVATIRYELGNLSDRIAQNGDA